MNVKFECGNQICILCGRPEIDPSPRQRKLSVRPWLAQLAINFLSRAFPRVCYTSVNALLMLTYSEFIKLSEIPD
jgi:hypothetical protein